MGARHVSGFSRKCRACLMNRGYAETNSAARGHVEAVCPSCGRVWHGQFYEDSVEWDCGESFYEFVTDMGDTPVSGDRCRACAFDVSDQSAISRFVREQEIERQLFDVLARCVSDGSARARGDDAASDVMGRDDVIRAAQCGSGYALAWTLIKAMCDDSVREFLHNIERDYVFDWRHWQYVDWIMDGGDKAED